MAKLIYALLIFSIEFSSAKASSFTQTKEKDLGTFSGNLKKALSNIIKTEEMGENGLKELHRQRKVLGRVHKNLGKIDQSLKEADATLTEMEHPFVAEFIPSKLPSLEEGGANFFRSSLLKRGPVKLLRWDFIFKGWKEVSLKIEGNSLVFKNKKNKKIIKKIDLLGARIVFLEKSAYGKKNCLEVKNDENSEAVVFFTKKEEEAKVWQDSIQEKIKELLKKKAKEAYSKARRKIKRFKIKEPKKKVLPKGSDLSEKASLNKELSTGAKNFFAYTQEDEKILDAIHAHLDYLDVVVREIGRETEDQTNGPIKKGIKKAEFLAKKTKKQSRRARRIR